MVFLKMSQISQENTCARVFFLIKVAGLRPEHLFYRTFYEWLLLYIQELELLCTYSLENWHMKRSSEKIINFYMLWSTPITKRSWLFKKGICKINNLRPFKT